MLPPGFFLPVVTAMVLLSRKDLTAFVSAEMADPFVILSVTFNHQICQHGFNMIAFTDSQSATCKECKETYAWVLLP